MTPPSKKVPKKWIFGSIEYKIGSARVPTACFGNHKNPIWPTISPNNIYLTIIATCAQYIYTVKIMKIMQVRGCVVTVITLV